MRDPKIALRVPDFQQAHAAVDEHPRATDDAPTLSTDHIGALRASTRKEVALAVRSDRCDSKSDET